MSSFSCTARSVSLKQKSEVNVEKQHCSMCPLDIQFHTRTIKLQQGFSLSQVLSLLQQPFHRDWLCFLTAVLFSPLWSQGLYKPPAPSAASGRAGAASAQLPDPQGAWQVLDQLILGFGDRNQQPSLFSGLPISGKPVWSHFWWAAVVKWSVLGVWGHRYFLQVKQVLGQMRQEVTQGYSGRACISSSFCGLSTDTQVISLTPLPPCFPTGAPGAESCEGEHSFCLLCL